MLNSSVRCLLITLLLFNGATSIAQTYCTDTAVRTEIIIQTNPDAVWNLLTDFNNYPSWHPYLFSVEGELTLKNKIKATLRSDSSSRFSAYILELEPGKQLAWGGSLGFIFRAKHYYIIEVIDANTIRFIQGEYWHGWFGKNYGRKIYLETCINFQTMNAKMKNMLEAK